MKRTKFPETMITKLNKISERSRQDSECSFDWLVQHFNVENLAACFHSLDGKKSVGIDEITKEEYGKDLEINLKGLVDRMKNLKYVPQPNRVTYIPKSSGGQRKLAIGAIEDKIIQTMFSKVLEAIYEPTFKNYSYGFRPNTGCHDALVDINQFLFSNYKPTVYEIDFADFFGSIDHKKLIVILGMRIKDKTFLRYISRMLKAGEWEKGNRVTNKIGIPQGNIASPILANIFAHYAIDRWFDATVAENNLSICTMARYCDDATFLFKEKKDAKVFEKLLKSRVERFGLRLNDSKCKLLTMDKRRFSQGHKQPTFNFLGFTFYIGKTQKGKVVPMLKTDRRGMRKKLKEIKLWLYRSRNRLSMMQMWNKIRIVLRGYTNYFGVSHNMGSVQKFRHRVVCIFFKVINRRSQKKSINWENFLRFTRQYPLPYQPVKRLFF